METITQRFVALAQAIVATGVDLTMLRPRFDHVTKVSVDAYGPPLIFLVDVGATVLDRSVFIQAT